MRRLLDRLTGRRTSAASSWICPACGELHDEMPAVVASAPLVWVQASLQERADDFDLTTDTCIWKGEHYFVRGVLEVPLTDRDGVLSFGVWASLSRENFFRYLPTFEEENEADRADIPPMFGWFSNSLPGYLETLNLKCYLHARTGGLRPLVELEQTEHPLSIDQQKGIPLGRAAEYVHAHLGI